MFCQSADSFSMQCTLWIWFRKLDLNAKNAPDDFNVFVWSQPLQFFFQVFIEILWFYVHFMQKMKNRVKKWQRKREWTVSISNRGRSWKILSLWTVDMDTHTNWHAHANLSSIGKKPADLQQQPFFSDQCRFDSFTNVFPKWNRTTMIDLQVGQEEINKLFLMNYFL